MKLAILVLLAAFTLFSASAFAEPYIALDKTSYKYDDTIKVSGTVTYEQGMVVVIQIRSSSDIVAIDQMFPPKSGKFSATFDAEGPKWQESGTYTLIVAYNGEKVEKTFQFTKPAPPPAPVTPTTPPQTPVPKTETEEPQKTEPQKPKVTIKGFPDPFKSPQYYYDRYHNEPEFKEWFDTTFVGSTIEEVVGYKPTHVEGFPDPDASPQYYIERYNNEEPFKNWFDSQFPDKTIYEIVGITPQSSEITPGWLKQYALKWSTSEIDNEQFIDKISEMIKQNIIEVSDDITIGESSDRSIPFWFKNNASWYSQNKITDDDFLQGIQYLIEQGIIVV